MAQRKYEAILNREYLEEEYTIKRRSSLDISKEIGCDHKTVAFYLHYHQIPLLAPLYGGRKMAQHNMWKGYQDIPLTQFTNIRNNARTRKIEFLVTIEELWDQYIKQNRLCALSGKEIGFFSQVKGNASLDRIDSTLSYTKDNVWWVDKDVNLAKQSLSVGEFVSLCKRVVEYTTLPHIVDDSRP